MGSLFFALKSKNESGKRFAIFDQTIISSIWSMLINDTANNTYISSKF